MPSMYKNMYPCTKKKYIHTQHIFKINSAEGGSEGRALYIDTQGTFRPKRIEQMARGFGMNTNQVLDNIIFGHAFSSDHLMKLLEEAPQLLIKSKYAIVIVDNLTSLFQAEYSSKKEEQIGQEKLNEFVHKLLQIGKIFEVAIVFTNDVVLDTNGGIKTIGDNITGRASNTRVYLTKSTICYASNLAEDQTSFSITSKGICDEL